MYTWWSICGRLLFSPCYRILWPMSGGWQDFEALLTQPLKGEWQLGPVDLGSRKTTPCCVGRRVELGISPTSGRTGSGPSLSDLGLDRGQPDWDKVGSSCPHTRSPESGVRQLSQSRSNWDGWCNNIIIFIRTFITPSKCWVLFHNVYVHYK